MIKYIAEVVSVGERNLNNPDRLQVGEQAEVVLIYWREFLSFDFIAPRFFGIHYGCLSNSAHLDGGSWKLIPYEDKEVICQGVERTR